MSSSERFDGQRITDDSKSAYDLLTRSRSTRASRDRLPITRRFIATKYGQQMSVMCTLTLEEYKRRFGVGRADADI